MLGESNWQKQEQVWTDTGNLKFKFSQLQVNSQKLITINTDKGVVNIR